MQRQAMPATYDADVDTQVASVHQGCPASRRELDRGISFRGDLSDVWRYQLDAWERSILFLDALRERGDNMLSGDLAAPHPVLAFESEMIADARTFDRPANYALLRIIPPKGCMEACADERKRPVIIVDPRAGHGPGIGGSKSESEVGMALHIGHPVYFVVFFPEPCPGQTLVDVLVALRRFVIEVCDRHPGAPPVLYGNCQAGWAIALLSADCLGLSGPAVLNGSPLSYWADEFGGSVMRLLGGLVGGVWLTQLLPDLGGGTFDGAWLVQNFENLNPASALWEKHAGLFARIDTERERFLDFERWWSTFYGLSREEMLAAWRNEAIRVARSFRVPDAPMAGCSSGTPARDRMSVREIPSGQFRQRVDAPR